MPNILVTVDELQALTSTADTLANALDELTTREPHTEPDIGGGGGETGGNLPLHIDSATPLIAQTNTIITIVGQGFGEVQGTGQVRIGIFGPKEIVSWAGNLIEFKPYTVPTDPTYNYSGAVAVYPEAGQVAFGPVISVHSTPDESTGGGTEPQLPTITGFVPTSGEAGLSVMVSGANFGDSIGTIEIAGHAANIVAWAPDSAVFQPANTGSPYSGPLILTTSAGDIATSTGTFSVTVPDTGGGDGGGIGSGSLDGIGYVSGGNGEPIVVNYIAPQVPGVPTERVSFKTVAGMSLQLTAPIVSRKAEAIITWNDPNSHSPPSTFYGDNVPDDNIVLPTGLVNVAGEAHGGLVNVELHTHDEEVVRFVPGADGKYSGSLDTTNEFNGPLVIDHEAWNSPPNTNPADGNFRQAKQRFTFYINTGKHYILPPPPQAARALGLERVFVEDFKTPLDISSTNNQARFSPFKAEPTGWGQYSEAIQVDPNNLAGARESPFYQRTDGDGAIRIRCWHQPDIVDPFPWNRKWLSGLFGTGRAGGVGGFYAPVPYYARARFYSPVGGVPWPAFWALTKEGLLNPTNGNVETDITENLGLFPGFCRQGAIYYPSTGGSVGKATGPEVPFTHNDPGNFDPHTFEVCVGLDQTLFFLDGVQTGPGFPSMRVDNTPTRHDWFMISLGFGGGWWQYQSTLPNTDHYDQWVTDFDVWAKPGSQGLWTP